MSKTAVGYIRLSQDGKSLGRQRSDINEYADRHGLEIVKIYDEGKRSSGFDDDRPEYQALLSHIENQEIQAVVVPNLSRLSRDRKERIRLVLNLDSTGVQLHSYEIDRPVNLDDDWELVQQSIRATTDDVEKRKEIERARRATKERLENGFDHGRPPFGLQFDEHGHYWVPGEGFPDAIKVIRSREDDLSWREIADTTGVNKDTARRIWDRRERYLEYRDSQ